ncbi:hypothetical protein ACFSJY_01855 [Thalassotalea euphylliae]|uniref:substrate-binding periplasmic protein n=1 Tax=Thalassotalea euphylliae TaxID=1655234 RepID=UPI00364230F8
MKAITEPIKKALYLKALCCVLLMCLFFTHQAISQTLKVGVTEWTGYTNTDGTGVYLSMLRDAFPDYELELQFNSYTRNLHHFNRGDVDMVIGVFREDVENAMFPTWYLDIEYPVTVYFKKASRKIESTSDLEGLVLGWLRGYDFDRYIDVAHKPYLLNSTQRGFNLALKERIDAFIDYEYNLPPAIADELDSYVLLASRKTYVAFKNTPRSKKLIRAYDARMQALRNSGKIEEYFGAEYPHTQFAYFNPSKPQIIVKTRDINLLRKKTIDSSDSLESTVLKTVLSQLPDFDVEVIKYDTFEQDKAVAQGEENVCFANKVKTAERVQHFTFSEPFTMYPGLRLYLTTPLTLESSEKLHLFDFVEQQNATLGIVPGQHYSASLNDTIAKLPKAAIYETTPDVLTQLAQLKKGLYDAKIEYPEVIAKRWPLISDKPIFSYPLQGASAFTLGHLMCTPSVLTQSFIEAFNRRLALFKNAKTFKAIHRLGAQEISEDEFNHLFNKAYGIDEN